MNQVAIVFGLIITALIGVGAVTALAPLIAQTENDNMEMEMINITSAASQYRWVNRNATTLAAANFESLTDEGYLDSDLYSDGDAESVMATDITATPGATPPLVTYDAEDEESCEWLLDRAESGRWPKVDSDSTSNACATETLTVEIK